ncbi:MAG: aspartate ammonia-lyase [Candidatus Lokiarchaeota archaeon]|nr:aspartate ammonia-lyase [Candidatus Lokiarchaeota archaeon]
MTNKNFRIEVDSLGEKKIPIDVYYGIQTQRGIENFPVSGMTESPIFIKSYVLLKKAAAIVNNQVGYLDKRISNAILDACDFILEGNLFDQFKIDVFQAGAGTSFNMNVNEVIVNKSLEILNEKKGNYKIINPNDHVNMAQSTNDSFPSAMNIAILFALEEFYPVLHDLSNSFLKKAEEFKDIIKSGRTHLQDAVPISLGQEFKAYGIVLKDLIIRLKETSKLLEYLPIGGTATGTGINSHPDYTKLMIKKLSEITPFTFKEPEDLRAVMQSRKAISAISSGLKELSLELIRIANDLRLLSSGPTTGLNEIELPKAQPGSSIMPGKVNPVILECLNMVAFHVIGNDLTVSLAVQAGQLELNVMMPLMIHNILESLKILTNFLKIVKSKCIDGIKANELRCKDYLEKNPSLATFLNPIIGYLEAAKIANESVEKNKSIKELILEKKLMSKEQLNDLFDKDFLIGIKKEKK